MKYLGIKLLAIVLVMSSVFAQATINPDDEKWGWDDYEQLKCDEGYNKVLNYCVWCDDSLGKFFDPVTKMCRSCPTGTTYNSTSSTCECPCAAPRAINATTKKCQCPGEQIFVNEKCKCPDDKPIWNTKKCVACPPGTNFDPVESQCYHCPDGFIRDPATHMCNPEFM